MHEFTFTMSFYLHNAQKVRIDKTTGDVIFQTRTMSGCVYYFPLTFDQFMAFNDAITLMYNVNYMAKRHYPLGQNLWFYYNSHGASFYDNGNGKAVRLYFHFHNFNLYLTHLHHKLLSFLRNEDSGRVTGGRRRKRLIIDNAESCNDKISNSKRPLSIVVQPKTGFETPKKHCGKWNSLSCPTNNAIMSPAGQTDTVLSEWNDTNSCRRNESEIAAKHTWKDLPSPEPVCLTASTNSSDSMDCDQPGCRLSY